MIRVDGVDQSSEPGESSCFQKTRTLENWWLFKCSKEFEGRRFGVGGTELMTSTGRGAIRVFVSAPIVKVFDCFTIETADGICINLKGFIDKERTLQSGFASEIFRHFMFGFPPCWKQVLTNCFFGESSIADLPSTSRTDQSPINSAEFPILSPSKNKLSTLEVEHGIESEKITVDDGKVSSWLGNELACGSLSSPTKKKSEDDVGSPTADTVETSNKKSGDDVGSLVVDTVKTNDNRSEDDAESPTVDRVKTNNKKNLDDVGSPAVDTVKTKDNKSGDDIGSPMVDKDKNKDSKSGDYVGLSEVDMVKPGDRKIDQSCMRQLRSAKRVISMDRGSNNADGSMKDMFNSERAKAKCKASSESLQSGFEDLNRNAKTGDKSVSRKNINSKGEDDVGLPTADTVKHSDKKSGDDVGSLVVDTVKTNDNRNGDDAESPTVDRVKTSNKKNLDVVGSPAVDTVKTKDSKSGDDIGSPMVDKDKNKDSESGDYVGLSEVHMVKPGDRKINQCSMKKLRSFKTVIAVDRKSKNADGSMKDMVNSERAKAKCKASSALRSSFKDLNRNAKTRDKSVSRKNTKSKGGESCVHEDPSSSGSTKRKINFDTEVTPRKEKRKETNALSSPDSLNLKRSRSGRRLVSPLEFWRNECPVYDADRTLLGIQEDLNVRTPKKGSSTEPEGRKRRRPVGKPKVSS